MFFWLGSWVLFPLIHWRSFQGNASLCRARDQTMYPHSQYFTVEMSWTGLGDVGLYGSTRSRVECVIHYYPFPFLIPPSWFCIGHIIPSRRNRRYQISDKPREANGCSSSWTSTCTKSPNIFWTWMRKRGTRYHLNPLHFFQTFPRHNG